MDLCGSCKQLVEEVGIRCDYCDQWFHNGCAGLSNEGYEMITSMKKTVFWYCKEDVKIIKSLIKKKKADEKLKERFIEGIDDIKTEMKKLTAMVDGAFSDQMKKLSSVVKESVSFAQVVKQSAASHQPVTRTSSNGVLVIAKETNVSNADIEKVFKERVDITKAKIGITRLKYLKSGGIFLGTKSAEDRGKLEEEARAKLGNSFKVVLPKPIIPELILRNISKTYSDEELMEEIKETNPGFNGEDKLKIVHKRKERLSQKWTYILQAIPATYDKLIDRYICVDYNDHYIKEHINVLRCFNCQQYNHKAENCTGAPVCSRCSKRHKTSDCSKIEAFTCINCVDANKNGAKFDTRHSCGSQNCAVHLSQMEYKQMKISYTAMPSW